MPYQILMPALSPTMEDGTLARWCVGEGDRIAPGDVIAEIETDKATLEFEADRAGTLRRILVAEGSAGVAVNTPIAELHPDVARRDPVRARVAVSPRARSVAKERGIDLGAVTGSGPGGRIIARDLEARGVVGAPRDEAAAQRLWKRQASDVPIDQKRKAFVALMAQANQEVPQFCLRREVLADRLLATRDAFNKDTGPEGPRLSITDFILRACALALQQVPEANAIWQGDRILRLSGSDLSIAIATEGGLVAPMIRDAETRSLQALSRELTALKTRARAGRLSLADLAGGSLAISNLGMHGVESFDAIVTPPHSAILAVGSVLRKPVVDDQNRIVPASTIQLSLSLDHRVTDGALGAALLSEISAGLEDPQRLLS